MLLINFHICTFFFLFFFPFRVVISVGLYQNEKAHEGIEQVRHSVSNVDSTVDSAYRQVKKKKEEILQIFNLVRN